MIVVTGSVRARNETVDEVVRLSLEHVHSSRAEPGCLLHSVHHDVDDPMRLVFLEHWADRAALAAHFAVPASRTFVDEVSALVSEPPTIDVFEAEAVDGGIAALVRRFYDEAWNRWDDSVVDEILSPTFVFRGSLGDEATGRDGFRTYRDKVRAAFPDFHTEVVELLVGGNRAAVRLRCTGHHEGDVLGLPATGASVAYEAAAFIRAEDGRLAEAWVLGDLDSLRRQCEER